MDCRARIVEIHKNKYFLWLTVGVIATGILSLVLQPGRGASGAVELKSQLSVPQTIPDFAYMDWDQVHLQPSPEVIVTADPEQELLDLLRNSPLSIDEPVRVKTQVQAASPALKQSSSKTSPWKTVHMKVTGYCACPKCCGKSADGITADMHRIRPGDVFVAADKKIPFGTRVIIPGYNRGRSVEVKDRGGLIRGNHLDLYFTSHKTAKKWGVKYLDVRIRLDE
jgi:3D (Asp-Asp-Asp) domain-containing protein